jgi:L-alanine-DL-glutamate epimerase-like enolase superfamily enzyme
MGRPPMRITAVDLFTYDAPFIFGYHSAHILRLKADSVIIALRCSNGITGFGESVPRPYVTGESPASVKELFGNIFIRLLIGQDVESIADAERLLDNLRQACREQGITRFQSAIGAIDIALLDALSKHHGIPVFHLLGPELRRHIPWSIVIPLLPEAVIRKFSEETIKRSFTSLKVLLGRDVAQNKERLKLVRSLFGDEIEVRIEVNGHWTREEAYANLHSLKGFRIAAVEQPVAKNDIEGLRKIRDAFGIPVIVDESMCSPEDAEDLISLHACDILNIKISKVGGLLAAYRIASLAACRGIPCQLGCHVGETAILTSAAFHFLIAAPGLLMVEGFSSLLFGEVTRIDDLDPGKQIMDTLTTRGLGFDPEETILRDRSSEKLCSPSPPSGGAYATRFKAK